MPILGATVGGVIGTVGGKLVGGVSGIALSKILEVYEKVKAAKIKKMSTIPQLMANLSPESDIMRGLMAVALDRTEEERITQLVEEAMEPKPITNSLYPSLEEFTRGQDTMNEEEYRKAQQLATEFMSDGNAAEYFILTPVPDGNAPEEFASTTDLLVLRWPTETSRPWEAEGESVLDIADLNKQ